MSPVAILLASVVVGQVSTKPSAEPPEATTVLVAPRAFIDVIFDAPPEGIANASRSDMVRAVARAARRFSDLAARPAPASRLDPCFRDDAPSPLLCLLLRLRPSFEAVRRANPDAAFDDLWARAADPDAPASDLALLVLYAPVLRKEQVQAVLLDLRAMAQQYHRQGRASPVGPAEQAALQDELFDVGVLVKPPASRDVQSKRDVQAFINDLFRVTFADLLEQRELRRFGGIDVHAPVGARLYLDGATLGSIEAPRTRIRDVPEGPHVLRIERDEYLPYEGPVRVKAQRKTVVRPDFVLAPNRVVVVSRTALFWTGLATAAGGVAVTAVVLADGGEALRCVPSTAPDCPPPARFRTLGPFLGAPLGYSLIGAGAAWSLGALLNDDDQTWPWWEVLLGAAIAGTAYGISAAANPPPR